MMMKRRIFSAVLFQIQINFAAGLTLYSASPDLTFKSFTLVCDLQGTTLGSSIFFTYNGTGAGGCSSPPNPSCNSPIGTITPGSQTVNFTLNESEILTKGSAQWSCSHGSQTAEYPARVVSYCQKKDVKYEEKKMLLSCNCGFPRIEAYIEYMKNGEDILSKVTVNLTSRTASCLPDSRAMDFSLEIADFPSGTVEACATMTSTENEVRIPICTVFVCGFSLAGFISVFLIELAAFITVMILLKLKKIIGGYSILKVVISCVYQGIALIIGLILGFVLQKCKENNLSIGLGVGLGCLLAVAHIVTVYVIHKKCEDTKKDDDDDGRKGTPASTSKVEFTDRKVSHVHLGTINGNKVDSQPKEPHRSLLESHRSSPEPHRSLLEPHSSLPEPHRSLPEPHRSLPEPHRPLPEPPATHPKQLDPIDDGATSSEKKKKKKKKKKKRSEAREEPEDQQE